MVHFDEFLKTEDFGQTMLPDKIGEKCQNRKCDILGDF